jgi:hypothetical protein
MNAGNSPSSENKSLFVPLTSTNRWIFLEFLLAGEPLELGRASLDGQLDGDRIEIDRA